jgi:hypothetical protein
VVRRAAVPREKNHPLAQRRRPLLHLGIEGASVELGHAQVTEDDVIALRLERGEGMPPIPRRGHHSPEGHLSATPRPVTLGINIASANT